MPDPRMFCQCCTEPFEFEQTPMPPPPSESVKLALKLLKGTMHECMTAKHCSHAFTHNGAHTALIEIYLWLVRMHAVCGQCLPSRSTRFGGGPTKVESTVHSGRETSTAWRLSSIDLASGSSISSMTAFGMSSSGPLVGALVAKHWCANCRLFCTKYSNVTDLLHQLMWHD